MTSEGGSAGEVLVGVDGSEPSLRAVDWAVTEAAARGGTLTVWCVAVSGSADNPMLWDGEEAVLVPAADVVRRAQERAAASPAIPVTGGVGRGDPAQQLLVRARGSDLLVVGDRGLGAFLGLLVGSVSERVAAEAACPVVVVRGEPAADLPVLVGVDGSAANQAALGYAFAAAERRRVELVALAAAEPRLIAPAVGSPAPPAVDVQSATDTVRAVLDEALQPWTERHPDVAVRRLPVVGGATRALVEASAEAGLVVVGSRGHGALTGTLFGSVSRHLLRQAHCPVAVVRD